MTTRTNNPSEADWYVSLTIGRTLCPHGPRCPRPKCAYRYGIETREIDAWFTGLRPTFAKWGELVPEGWRHLGSADIKSCKEN